MLILMMHPLWQAFSGWNAALHIVNVPNVSMSKTAGKSCCRAISLLPSGVLLGNQVCSQVTECAHRWLSVLTGN